MGKQNVHPLPKHIVCSKVKMGGGGHGIGGGRGAYMNSMGRVLIHLKYSSVYFDNEKKMTYNKTWESTDFTIADFRVEAF